MCRAVFLWAQKRWKQQVHAARRSECVGRFLFVGYMIDACRERENDASRNMSGGCDDLTLKELFE